MIRRKKRPAFAGLFLCLLPAKTQRKQKTAPGRGLFLYLLHLLRQLAGGDQDDLVSGPVSGVGPGISIGEVLTSNLTGPLLINGLLHVQNDQARLCETLAESFPPQCGGKFLEVESLDLRTMDGLRSEGSVTWSDQPVQVLGTVEGEVLTISGTVR